eukprot:5971026-Amphidinium_carterae.1
MPVAPILALASTDQTPSSSLARLTNARLRCPSSLAEECPEPLLSFVQPVQVQTRALRSGPKLLSSILRKIDSDTRTPEALSLIHI